MFKHANYMPQLSLQHNHFSSQINLRMTLLLPPLLLDLPLGQSKEENKILYSPLSHGTFFRENKNEPVHTMGPETRDQYRTCSYFVHCLQNQSSFSYILFAINFEMPPKMLQLIHFPCLQLAS